MTTNLAKNHLTLNSLLASRFYGNPLILDIILDKKNKVSVKDFFSKCEQLRSFLLIFSHLQRKSVT